MRAHIIMYIVSSTLWQQHTKETSGGTWVRGDSWIFLLLQKICLDSELPMQILSAIANVNESTAIECAFAVKYIFTTQKYLWEYLTFQYTGTQIST